MGDAEWWEWVSLIGGGVAFVVLVYLGMKEDQ